jgi:hypothetical protein
MSAVERMQELERLLAVLERQRAARADDRLSGDGQVDAGAAAGDDPAAADRGAPPPTQQTLPFSPAETAAVLAAELAGLHEFLTAAGDRRKRASPSRQAALAHRHREGDAALLSHRG